LLQTTPPTISLSEFGYRSRRKRPFDEFEKFFEEKTRPYSGQSI